MKGGKNTHTILSCFPVTRKTLRDTLWECLPPAFPEMKRTLGSVEQFKDQENYETSSPPDLCFIWIIFTFSLYMYCMFNVFNKLVNYQKKKFFVFFCCLDGLDYMWTVSVNALSLIVQEPPLPCPV